MENQPTSTPTTQSTPAEETQMETQTHATAEEAAYNNNVQQQGVTMDITTFTSQELINELVNRGILKADFADKEAARVERATAKAEKAAALNAAKSGILEVLTNPELAGNKYFSVKKTSNSIGFMDHVTGERSIILKALTKLVEAGKVRKTGLVAGEEKPTSEVNAFQIRYARVTELEVPAKEEEAAAADEAK